MKKVLLALLASLTIIPLSSFSYDNNKNDYYMAFEIVQDQFVFDKTTVKRAFLEVTTGGMYQGLRVQLKPAAAQAFHKMTQANINKHVNLIFNKKIISTSILMSSLGNDLLLKSISQNDAQEFINHLSNLQPNKI